MGESYYICDKLSSMFSLFLKEIKGFFNSITGYIVIIVFLVINGVIMWVFPGELNVLDSGYASMDTLFTIAPWVFLFLVPAVTMKTFADEKKSGTIELLITRPLTDLQIILSKYLASIVLILLALIPTLVYYVTIYYLGNPVGNIDAGGTWGSYTGLFFLGAVYSAIGVFSSSLTNNQVISFILAIAICFFLYAGFESISMMNINNQFSNFIIKLGINEHYQSISRGVIDSRDLIYFLGVIILFIVLTKTSLQSRKW